MHKLWLLQLVPQHRLGKWVAGTLIFAVLFSLFSFIEASDVGQDPPTLFFSLIIAYIIPVFGHITARSKTLLTELKPFLEINEQEFQEYYATLDSVKTRDLLLQLGGGAAAGTIHTALVMKAAELDAYEALSSLPGLLTAIGTIAVWMLMTTVVYTLIQQGLVFARIGAKHVHLTLGNWRSMLPFGRVAILSSLALLGALALYPLIGLEGGMNSMEILPGAIATACPMIAIFLLPVWPLQRRMSATKHSQLQEADALIAECIGKQSLFALDAASEQRLSTLLTYRRELAELPSWPFDIGNVTRLSLYLVIPPLTWVAAALIENVVDAML